MSPHAVIIEDQDNNIEVLGRLLKIEGFSYEAFTSSQDVMESLDHLTAVDVIFLDLELPDSSDFYTVFTTLKEQPNLSDVPLVAYTVHLSEIKAARNAGFDHFLGKPLKTSLFPNQLKRIMSGVPVWDY